jgi:hypothetical protein
MASAPRRSSLRAIFPHELEQDLIREFFGGAAGFFVEVGANEPEFHSQTRYRPGRRCKGSGEAATPRRYCP